MDPADARARLSAARVAHLATADAAAVPHLVPIVFALDGDLLYFAVDHKPKKGPDLRRLRNIAANPRVSVLVDRYDEDWRRLWWVRADGRAAIHAEHPAAVAALTAKYSQYQDIPPLGPYVTITIDRLAGWSFA
ncbi:TIGR03668 family PPOX class F420-dependent oxidoreductase [Nocardia panacis]|uniref:TIGR03668 family PPOX class F420-dependent oxidoreductase n=1 Tax=Nocardia panacis TaxID=2340916 RepID=UPI0026A029A7